MKYSYGYKFDENEHVIPSLDCRVCAHFLKAYLYITQEFIHLYRWVRWVNWLHDIYTTKVIPKSIICVDVIKDGIDDDKDLIIKLMCIVCIVRDIVFTTYIINAFVPKQVDIGLDNSAEYTILVCCDALYQIIGITISEMSRF